MRVLSPPVGAKFHPDGGAAPRIGRSATVPEGPRHVAARPPSARRGRACAKRRVEIGEAVRIGRVGRVFPSFTPFCPAAPPPGAVGGVATTFGEPGAEPRGAASSGSRSNAVHRRGCIKQKVAGSERAAESGRWGRRCAGRASSTSPRGRGGSRDDNPDGVDVERCIGEEADVDGV